MDSRTALSRSSNVFFSSIYLFVWLRWALVVACGVQFHDQGCKLGPLHWEDTVLATGPPGKPQVPQFTLFSQRLESICQVITKHLYLRTQETRDTDARDSWSDREDFPRTLAGVALPWLWPTDVRGSVSLPAEAWEAAFRLLPLPPDCCPQV